MATARARLVASFTAVIAATALASHFLIDEASGAARGPAAPTPSTRPREVGKALDPARGPTLPARAAALAASKVGSLSSVSEKTGGRAEGAVAGVGSGARATRALGSSDRIPDADARRTGSRAPRNLSAEERRKLAAELAKVDWDHTLKDLVAQLRARRTGQGADPDTYIESAQVNIALAEAAKTLGLPGPRAALGDPTVRSVVVPAWLNALGVNLDEGQSAAIATKCQDGPPAPAAAGGTFLDQRQASIQSRLALEQSISQVLTPEQMATYAQNVADDPLMRASPARVTLEATSTSELAQGVASQWSRQFRLGTPSSDTAQTIAQQYVASVLALPPVPSGLDAVAAHTAALTRSSQLVALQQQAEQALAQSPVLTPTEQARAARGSSCTLRLNLK
ncbi:MAG TPA: hypothetical protein VFF73_06500 [Planctomycetota bacterium]|nr:hypothetical protein [Planctomycetota bacterium]